MRHAGSLIIIAVVLFTAAFACNMSTANLSALKVGQNAEVSNPSSNFAAGDTIYAVASVSNNPGKGKVKMYIQAENVKGVAPGTVVANSVVNLDIDGDAVAKYEYPTVSTASGGTFKMVAELYNEEGEKKDSLNQTIIVAPGSAAEDED